MWRHLFFGCLFCLGVGGEIAFAQNTVGIGTVSPNQHAALHIVAANGNQGLLIPQLTTNQRTGIAAQSPEDDGLLVFDVTEKTFFFWANDRWSGLAGDSPGSTPQQLSFDELSSILALTDGGTVDLGALNLRATNILLDNISGITATNVQEAIQELSDLVTSAGTDDQELQLSGTILSLENGGNPVDLSPLLFSGSFNDLTDIPVNLDTDATDDLNAGDNITLLTNDAAYITLADLLDNNPSNEAISDISLSGTILSIEENGAVAGTVDLSSLTFSGSFNDLTDIPVNLDTDATDDLNAGDNISLLTNDAAYITLANLLDNDPSNEAISNISLSGTELTIQENGIDAGTVDLSDINSDDQTVSQFDLSGAYNEELTILLEDDPGGSVSINLHSLEFDNNSDLSGPLGQALVKDGIITNAKLADNAVDGNKIQNGAVTDEKVASVSPSKLSGDGATIGQVLKWDGNNWVPENQGPVVSVPLAKNYGVDPLDFVIYVADRNAVDPNASLVYGTENTYVGAVNIGDVDIMAPIHLPDDAVITGMTVFYWDESADEMTVSLTRKPFMGSEENVLTSPWTSTGVVPGLRTVNLSTFINNTIDNSLYTYRVHVKMKGANTPEFRIHGILINYDAL